MSRQKLSVLAEINLSNICLSYVLTPNRPLIYTSFIYPKLNMDGFCVLAGPLRYVLRQHTINRMKFPPCVNGNREGGKNSYTFYYIYIAKFFAFFAHHLDSSVGIASDSRSKGLCFHSRSWHSFSFTYIYFFYQFKYNFTKGFAPLFICDLWHKVQ